MIYLSIIQFLQYHKVIGHSNNFFKPVKHTTTTELYYFIFFYANAIAHINKSNTKISHSNCNTNIHRNISFKTEWKTSSRKLAGVTIYLEKANTC